MRDSKGALQIASRAGDEAVKPEPPKDMWEKLDKLVAEQLKQTVGKPPEGSFDADGYAAHTGLKKSSVQHRLFDLVKAGKLKRVKFGYKYYYTFAE